MADRSPWRPEARHPEIPHLRQREVDVQLEFDVAKEVCERRVDRAVCPSPDEQLVAAHAQTIPKVPIASGFTAVNARAGAAPKATPVAEKASASASGSAAQQPPEASRSSPPASTVVTKQQEIEDRDWEIVQIIDKQFTHGIVWYLVRWAATTLPAAVLRHGDSGNVTVVVDGQDFAVCQYSTGPATEASDEQQRIVEWKESWHCLWELADAIKLVRKYEQTHAQAYGTSDKELKRARKDFVLQHPSWDWSMKFRRYLDQESRPDPQSRRDILQPDFLPESGGDYTASFLTWQRDEIASGQCQIPNAGRYLNRPLRQYLRFNQHFFDEESAQTYNAGTQGKLRALYVHVIGLAHRQRCTNCQNLTVPFSKCVSLGTDFSGACTCCQFMNKGQECSYHHQFREFFEEKMRKELKRQREAEPAAAPLEIAINDDDEYDSSDTDEDSGYGGSSPASDAMSNDDRSASGRHLDKGKAPVRINAAALNPEGDGQDLSSQSTAPDSSQQSAMSASGGARSDRRNKRRKVTKAESTEESPSPKAHLHPDSCEPNGMMCRHPTIGHILPPLADGSAHPPNVVFNNQRFSAGEATDEQVRYIISRSSCQNTERLEKAWQNVLKEAKDEGEDLDISKETALSHFFADWLNDAIRKACPAPSVPRTEMIDLTLDDD